MSWVILAVIAAAALGITEFLTKKAYNHFDALTLSWFRNFFALPVFFALLIFQGIPTVDKGFWELLLIAAPLELIIGVLFFFAIKLTPLSLVLPFTTFITVFVIIGAHFINNEPLKLIYFLAFLFILIGAYFIQETRSIKWKQLARNDSELGIVMMIVTAALFGITVPIGQRMVDASSAFFYLAVNFTILVLLLTPVFLKKTNTTYAMLRKHGRELLVVGIFNGIFLSSIWLALTHGPAGPISAINNLSIIVAILLAGTFLKEKGILRRLGAGTLMVVGAVIAALG